MRSLPAVMEGRKRSMSPFADELPPRVAQPSRRSKSCNGVRGAGARARRLGWSSGRSCPAGRGDASRGGARIKGERPDALGVECSGEGAIGESRSGTRSRSRDPRKATSATSGGRL